MVTVARSSGGGDIQIVASIVDQMTPRLRELGAAVDRFGRESVRDVQGLDRALEQISSEMRALRGVAQESLEEFRGFGSALQRASGEASGALGAVERGAAGAAKATKELDAIGIGAGLLGAGVEKIGQLARSFAAMGVAAAGTAVTVRAFQDALGFEERLVKIQNRVGATAEDLVELRQEILDVAKSAGISPSAAADSFLVALREGAKSSADALTLLRAGITTARGDFDTLGPTIESVSKILSAYGLGIEESARVSQMLSNLSKATGKSVQELGDRLDDVAPAARESGVALESLLSAVLVINDRGGDLRKGFGDLAAVIRGGKAETEELTKALIRAQTAIDPRIFEESASRFQSTAERTSASIERIRATLLETFGDRAKGIYEAGLLAIERPLVSLFGNSSDIARADAAVALKALDAGLISIGESAKGAAASQASLADATTGARAAADAQSAGLAEAQRLLRDLARASSELAEASLTEEQRAQRKNAELLFRFRERIVGLESEGEAVDQVNAAYRSLAEQIASVGADSRNEKVLESFRELLKTDGEVRQAAEEISKANVAALKAEADARFELLDGVDREVASINRSIDAQQRYLDTLKAEKTVIESARDALEQLRKKRLEDLEARKLARDEGLLDDFRQLIDGAQQAEFASILAGDAEKLKLRAVLEADAQSLIGLQKQLDEEQLAIEVKLQLERLEAARLESFGAGFRDALQRIEQDLKPFNVALRFTDGAIGSFASNAGDALTDLVTGSKNAKDAFSDFARQFGTDILRMLNQILAFRLAASIFGGLFPGGGFPGGATDVPVFPGTALAKGGVMPGNMLPINSYAQGGIANSPQLALFGEGRGAEAFVPLPGPDRGIPVEFRNAPSAASSPTVPPINVSVVVNMGDGTDRDGMRQKLAAEARVVGDIVAQQLSAGVNRGLVQAVRNIRAR